MQWNAVGYRITWISTALWCLKTETAEPEVSTSLISVGMLFRSAVARVVHIDLYILLLIRHYWS